MSRRVQPKRETKGKKAPRPAKKARAESSLSALECQVEEKAAAPAPSPSPLQQFSSSGLCAHCHVLPSKVVFLCAVCDGFTCTEDGRCKIARDGAHPTKCANVGCTRYVMCGGMPHPKGASMRCGGDRERCSVVYCWEHVKSRACKLCGVPQCGTCSTLSAIPCNTCMRIRLFRPDVKHPDESARGAPAPPSAVAAAH